MTTEHHQTANSRKRSYSNGSSEPERPAKRSMLHTLVSRIKWTWDYAFGNDVPKNREIEASMSKIQDLCHQINNLELTLERERGQHAQNEQSQREEYNILKKDYDILESNFIEIKSTAISALEAKKKDACVYNKVSDDQFRNYWKALAYNIRCFVQEYLDEHPENECEILKAMAYGHGQQATPIALGDEIIHLRSSIIRRDLWQRIYHHVFSGYGKIWNGRVSQALTQLLHTQNPPSRRGPEYLRMISRVKHNLDPELERKNEDNNYKARIDYVVLETAKGLRGFIPPEGVRNFKIGMRDLLLQAVALHSNMMKSKAVFRVQWIGMGDGTNICNYDPATMDSLHFVDADAHDYVVKLAESPALWKVGNADGGDFNSSTIICKSLVVLGEMEVEISPEDECAT